MRLAPVRLISTLLPVALAFAAAACDANDPTRPAPGPTTVVTPTGLLSSIPPEIFVGAGDMATCNTNNDEATAALLDNIPGTVFVLGDNVYENGTNTEYANCYNPTWGRHKARTRPSAGNHDYNTNGAAGYYNYFGAAAGDPTKGYYSFELGAWHIIVLNSNISMTATSAQVNWLKADLAAHPNLCTAAYWHHPLYSSTGGTGSGGVTYSSVRPLVDALYAGGADVMMGGHRHTYERMAPIKPDGSRDAAFGVREFIAGTGGRSGGQQSNPFPASEARNGSTYGVLKLYLYEDSYAWKFIPVAGKTFTDSGSTACHGVPGGSPPAGSVSAALSTVSVAPTTLTAGGSAATITVTAKNAAGNPVSGATVVISATGSLNTLTQPTGPTGANGVATGTLSSTVAQDKVVSAKINNVAITQTATMTVQPDVAAELAFTVHPSSTAPGAAITPAVEVTIGDQFGNLVASAADVTVAIGNNPGGGTLSGTTTVAAQAGVATFGDLSIDQKGIGYRLVASATGLTSGQSSPFEITGTISAGQSTVRATPTSIVAGVGTATITVTARDVNSNPVSGAVVVLAATGSENTLTQPAGPTDASGVATGTLSSTFAESKTVSATIDGSIVLTATVTVTAPGSAVVLVGAGSIARCDKTDDEATAALLDNIEGTVFTLGSAVYVTGSLADFTNCYGPSWGRHRARTRPAVGYKEYLTAGAAGHFQYFGSAAGDSGLYYYSYDVGDWHIIVLNDQSSQVPTKAGSPQELWLRADLAASAKQCTLAYWEHPRFSSSEATPRSSVKPFWDALYAAGADVVLNAHDRNYERFAPQTPTEVADPQNGIRQFVVGTGGQLHTAFGTVRPNSEVRNSTTFGVLKLTLGSGSYSWEFIPVAGGTFIDSGTGTCH